MDASRDHAHTASAHRAESGAFTLDTSGEVGPMLGARYGSPGCTIDAGRSFYRWSHLTPFAQGYVGALFADLYAARERELPNNAPLGFLHLSPEALGMILGDCAAFAELCEPQHRETKYGAGFWNGRNHGQLSGFPPLAPYLGDDGKIYLRVAS